MNTMNTIAMLVADRMPTYLPEVGTVPTETLEATKTRQGKLEYIAAFNNCVVEKTEGMWALIHATDFVARGIAGKVGLAVYRVSPSNAAWDQIRWAVRLGGAR